MACVCPPLNKFYPHGFGVTNGPQPGSLIVEAYILEARLHTAPSAEAKTALKEIKFR